MTQLWEQGQLVDVVADEEGKPIQLTWEGCHHVQNIHRDWTVDDRWWDVRIFRRYFKVTTDTGLLLEVFQDKVTGSWYLHRIYD